MIRLKTIIAGHVCWMCCLTIFVQPNIALHQAGIPQAQEKVENTTSAPTQLLPNVNWDVDWNVSRQRPGYPLLKRVKHFPVHPAAAASGAYHHHPQITYSHDKFFATWSNHPSGEDGPGQQVLGAFSRDGMNWNSMGVVFPPRDNVRVSTANGRSLVASPFIKCDKRLFAVAVLNDGVGYGSFETPVTGTPDSEQKTPEFRKRIRKPHGFLVREVYEPNKFGPIFWLGDRKPPSPKKGFSDVESTFVSAAEREILLSNLREPLALSPFDFGSPKTEVNGKDGSLLCEPTTIQTDDGLLIRYLRDLTGSQKMYVQFFKGQGSSWTLPKKTNIPDAPSKSVLGKTPSGLYFLIGNQVGSKRGTRRDPLTIGLSNDAAKFDRAFAIRWRAPKFQIPRQQQTEDGRGRGFQYPSFVIVRDALWVIYSVNKEAIDVSCVDFLEISK